MYAREWNGDIIKLTHFIDDGILCPIEYSDLPFQPKRTFFVSNVSKGAERGKHAHYETEQLLICIQGQILVKLFDGSTEIKKIINPTEGIYVGRLVWDSQVFLTGSDILLSLCSTRYDKCDYIEDRQEFERIVREHNRRTTA